MKAMRLAAVLMALLFLAVVGCKKEEAAKEPAKQEAKKAEPARAPEVKKEEPKAEEPKKEEVKKEEPKAEEPPKEEAKKEEPPKEEPKKEEPPAVNPVDALLDKAIAASGGLEQIRSKLAAYSYKSEGTYFGRPYKMNGYWKAPDQLVMEMDDGAMVMGYVGRECWSKMGDVVVDCMKDEATGAQQMLQLMQWCLLFPLKQEGTKLEALPDDKLGEQAVAALKATTADGSFSAVLFFDRETGLLAGTRYEGFFGPGKGLIETTLADYKDLDGLKVAMKSTMTFNGRPTISETVLEEQFGTVDETKLKRPEMAVGQPKVRALPERTVVFGLHKGPYTAIGMAVGGLFGYIGKNQLAVMGAPAMIYLKDPKTEKDPANYETEVQIEVIAAEPPPAAEGPFAVKKLPAGDIVAMVAVGPYDKVAEGYPKLVEWAAANGYDLVGPAGMFTYNNPMDTLPDKLVSELFFPVKKK
jgi:effector-binding domain-containing protein